MKIDPRKDIPPVEQWKDSVVLRSNNGMIRDCWFDEGFFCIRQIKFQSDGGQAVTKVIRLSPDETNMILRFLQDSKG